MGRSRGRRAGMVLLLVLLWAGLASAQETATGEAVPGSFEQTLADLPVEALHLVQVEDNLHLIAAYYYGDARQWPRLYAANRALIGRNPSLIHRGQILKVPLPAGWAPLEPYDRFLARVRAAGIPGLTAPPEPGGGQPAAEVVPLAGGPPQAPSARATQPAEGTPEPPPAEGTAEAPPAAEPPEEAESPPEPSK